MAKIDNINNQDTIDITYQNYKQDNSKEQEQEKDQDQEHVILVDAIADEAEENPHNYTNREIRIGAGVGVGVVTGIVLCPPVGIVLGSVAALCSKRKGPVGAVSRSAGEMSLALRDKYRELKERRRRMKKQQQSLSSKQNKELDPEDK
eukprot:CAMPEP_0118693818 /NCGR_PEP_ID=MMETSP0800-20121206/12136_1 /TAXON_ID=210618 ORGANISM="Striatella unipunctata, Strain CCMP2910" /NCGR_SAMPLE_ID=MMETSP0800 /ASSEMBLY_ACC=CAM_ASM_000638 /LENGTH=147 /DNA_ID=CAMNT_0006592129 /DNA_START=272 /DNA_END=715 /DNA_ORIENTATION=-